MSEQNSKFEIIGFDTFKQSLVPVIKSNMKFAVGLKINPTKGDLVYEYNPFRNYRLTSTGYAYNNQMYSPKQLLEKFNYKFEDPDHVYSNEECLDIINNLPNGWEDLGISKDSEQPTLLESGELVDFVTDELKFDLSNPVNILPQYSYDNSVNLIINDGKNPPLLINSRFSATDRNKYQIVDRKGDNDSNIYDQGSQFDIDTSLYKTVSEIPILNFIGVFSGGALPIGNYHFYFRYTDADGNSTDFIAESGLVSIFIGNTPYSIRSGFRNENSFKLVKFTLSNIDSGYQYVQVYYTKSTSEILESSTTTAYQINQKYLVNASSYCEIVISGYEDVTEVTLQDINPMYQIAGSVQAQAQCQNRLFFGNVHKPDVPYDDLTDLSLRFLPYVQQEDYPLTIDQNYTITSNSYGYYDPSFIYNKVGYWNHEIYRFGIVYILSDGTLSPVFNVRGKYGVNESIDTYTNISVYDSKGNRQYITYDEITYLITNESGNEQTSNSLYENSKGVITLNVSSKAQKQQIYSVNFKVEYQVLTYLKDTLKIKGFFFVRQKRIPTILCQAYTIGIDPISNTPIIPIQSSVNTLQYVSERFIDSNKLLDNSFDSRLYYFTSNVYVRTEGAICPEYDVNSSYLNSIFSGNEVVIQESDFQPTKQGLERISRNFYVNFNEYQQETSNLQVVNIIGVEDNTKLVAINENLFSARAGEAEEAFRYEYLERENKMTDATNLVRGSYGPYLGITGYSKVGKLIDIRIPGFNKISTSELYLIRYNDFSPYYAISDRIDLKNIQSWFDISNILNKPEEEQKTSTVNLQSNLYRGDCYICQFTHRVNRNFQDPSAPTNDKIVDPNCWKDNYEITDSVLNYEKFEDINLGDVNAIQLGMWVTIPVRSTFNLNVRALDDSNIYEVSLTGHPRGFYPYHPISGEGSYKIPEALCYNQGFEKSLSERTNFEVPDVPAIKNDFTNRILYSDIHINDAFKNGFRVFQGTNYRDYPKTYGSITKLVEFRGNLICVFEHGIAIIPVNERALAGEGAGGNVYINTSNILPENPNIISDVYGSQWPESVIKTPSAVYGVDTIGKKIWRTNGSTFECISDFKIQEFLNKNITLTERETSPIIGIRNVKTHFNRFKNDVMFTFYDNLYGFEEAVWNVCFNENLSKWVTFYSWIPSYSENIYNQYFSFNRDTSKWIAKLGISNYNNAFSDGVTLENNIITKQDTQWKTPLHLSNRTLPSGTGIDYKIVYTLERDNYKNYENFSIVDNQLVFTGKYEDITSELYVRNDDGTIKKDDRGRRIQLVNPKNQDKIVILLNIKANIKVSYNDQATSLQEAYATGFADRVVVDAGYYQSTVAVIPEYNQQFLTTDFWKHGQAGIIDIADKIYPTYWYGKQHPFEFEFVVAENPQMHKIFDNLEIISNSAEPESFHYEIVGDCYEFSKDKKNMYIRQEATKELYQYNGCDITYDNNYTTMDSIHRKLTDSEGNTIQDMYDKSTMLPLYYSRQDSMNSVEDYYHLKDNVNTKDFSSLAGGEIVYNSTLDEFKLWNHTKGINMQTRGRLRGNMQYNEDRWKVQINPINFRQKNEPNWSQNDLFGRKNLSEDKVPIELTQAPIPNEVLQKGDITYDPNNPSNSDIPEDLKDRAIVTWNDSYKTGEVKLKDKYIKIRIRYTGNKLAVITAITTLYSISY